MATNAEFSSLQPLHEDGNASVSYELLNKLSVQQNSLAATAAITASQLGESTFVDSNVHVPRKGLFKRTLKAIHDYAYADVIDGAPQYMSQTKDAIKPSDEYYYDEYDEYDENADEPIICANTLDHEATDDEYGEEYFGAHFFNENSDNLDDVFVQDLLDREKPDWRTADLTWRSEEENSSNPNAVDVWSIYDRPEFFGDDLDEVVDDSRQVEFKDTNDADSLPQESIAQNQKDVAASSYEGQHRAPKREGFVRKLKKLASQAVQAAVGESKLFSRKNRADIIAAGALAVVCAGLWTAAFTVHESASTKAEQLAEEARFAPKPAVSPVKVKAPVSGIDVQDTYSGAHNVVSIHPTPVIAHQTLGQAAPKANRLFMSANPWITATEALQQVCHVSAPNVGAVALADAQILKVNGINVSVARNLPAQWLELPSTAELCD